MSVLAAALWLAFLPGAASPQAEETTLSLKLAALPTKAKPRMQLEGAASLPDATVLRVTLHRLQEHAAGGQILTTSNISRGGFTPVKGRKFGYNAIVEGAGAYRAVVELLDEDQAPALREGLKGKARQRRWEFDFPAWTDESLAGLGPRLAEIEAAVKETVEVIRQFARASAAASTWKAESARLAKQAGDLIARIDKSEYARLYTAAAGELVAVLRNVQANANYLVFTPDGKLEGAFDYHTGGKAETYRAEEFSFDRMAKYAEEVVDLGGREFCLWLVKDVRRSGSLREPLRKALKELEKRPGVDPHAEALERGEDLDDLEKLLRKSPVREQEAPGK